MFGLENNRYLPVVKETVTQAILEPITFAKSLRERLGGGWYGTIWGSLPILMPIIIAARLATIDVTAGLLGFASVWVFEGAALRRARLE